MKKLKQLLASPVTTIALFVLAAALLAAGTIGGARAALTRESEYFSGGVALDDIGVTLMENGEMISYRNYIQDSAGQWSESTGRLLENLLAPGELLQPGRAYAEELSVQNSGSIDEYVRVTIYKYWMDEDGGQGKEKALSPELIDLNFLTDNGWWIDEASSTPERTVLYYTRVLPVGETTPPLTDTLTIDGSVVDMAEQERTQDGAYTRITTTYLYHGKRFRVEAEVNAVQTHNAEDAILSAWGRRVTLDGNGGLIIR